MTIHTDLFARIEPPQELRGRITKRVEQLRMRRARVRFALFGATSGLATLALIPTSVSLMSQFSASGAADYLSLLSTDTDIVLAHAWEFAQSLLEVLPLFGITLVLTAIVVLLWALPRASIAARSAFRSPNKLALS